MINSTRFKLPLLALSALAFAAPAAAQEAAREPTVFDGDFLTVGAGVAIGPSYEGSDDYSVFPAPAVAGRVGGIGVNPRPAGIALDFINDPKGSKISFQAGPAFRLRFSRNTKVKDAVVEALGKRDVAVEVGGNVGFSINRVTNPYDSLTFGIDVRKDVAGAHEGWVIAPTATFQTPVSRGAFAALTVSAEHVDNKFARYYFSVSPEESLASGLRQYTARKGWKNVSAGLIGAVDLDGDLTNGGFAVFVAGNYARLLGNFERAPIVDDRGSPNQWTGAIGIGYTF
ncbi:MAG: MipA/OmpV family protein [Sphingobium sp.]